MEEPFIKKTRDCQPRSLYENFLIIRDQRNRLIEYTHNGGGRTNVSPVQLEAIRTEIDRLGEWIRKVKEDITIQFIIEGDPEDFRL